MRYTFLVLLLFGNVAVASEPLHLLSWNVESGGASPAVISRQLAEFSDVDVFALQEVDESDVHRFGDAIRQQHGESFRYFASWTGRNDRLMVAFDNSQLQLLEWREMFRYGKYEMNDWRHRSPLVCLFEHQVEKTKFYLVVVHLARGSAKLRQEQARGLRTWASAVSNPAIAIGDFNFDYDFRTLRGNQAFKAFTAGQRWTWARPEKLIDTNWSDRDGDGIDNYPESCLDFAFYAALEPHWRLTSEVIVRAGDFPDDETTSDHRPVLATLDFVATAASYPKSLLPSRLTAQPDASLAYWLNTSSNVRHNKGCRNFNNTKRGRPCSASEGRACGICGG